MTDTVQNTVVRPTLGSGKRIYVDLSAQMLYAGEGESTLYAFPVSTGKKGKTPIGNFTIWIKLRFTDMRGGRRLFGTYYDLKDVPYTMYFYNEQVSKAMGFGIHGTYWHNNFGRPMSHGCVNMRIEDAAEIYDWADPPTAGDTTHASAEHPGTPVTIYGTAPRHSLIDRWRP